MHMLGQFWHDLKPYVTAYLQLGWLVLMNT